LRRVDEDHEEDDNAEESDKVIDDSTDEIKGEKEDPLKNLQVHIMQGHKVHQLKVLEYSSIKAFKDYCDYMSLSNTKINRNELISAEMRKLLTTRFMAAEMLIEGASWEGWDDEVFFKNLLIIYPSNTNVLHLSVEEKLRQIAFNIEPRNPMSLDPFILRLNDVIEETSSIIQSRESHFLRILIEALATKKDPTTVRLMQLVGQGNKVTTFSQFKVKLIQMANRICTAFHDVEACGAQVHFNKFQNSFSEKKTTHISTTVPITTAMCYGCGRSNHKKTDCALKAHEDWNTENKAWPLSSKGIAWKAKNALVLPFNASLSGNVVPKFKFTPKTSELNTIAVDDHVNDAVLLANILINNILLPITCLIDTGALQANYISREVAESLKAYGLQFCKCNSVVCLAIHNKCSNVKEEVNFKLKFLNELTFQYDIIQITAKLVNNLNYDVIIGLPTIRQYNLLAKFPKRFNAISLNSQRSPVEHPYSSSQKAITHLSETINQSRMF
jgi:hypothetical protein